MLVNEKASIEDKGTIARLIDKSIYDINLDQGNHQGNRQVTDGVTDGQRTTNEQNPTNKNDKKDKNDNERRKKKVFTSDSVEYGLAKTLLSLIRANKNDFKEPNLQNWAKHIDYMIRLDHRKPEIIEAVIRWCTQDAFWHANILSTEKLRKQFDRLEIEMENSNERKGISKNEPPAQEKTGRSGEGKRAQISGQDFGELHNPLE